MTSVDESGAPNATQRETPLEVEIWSDVVCPWCYIGKRRFEAALAGFEHRDSVRVTYRSFELDPHAPALRDTDLVTHLERKYGVSRAEAEAMNQRVTDNARAEGLDYNLELAKPGNTFDAHRVAHLARERGVGEEVIEGLFAAYFTDGKPIADHDSLVEVAVAAGLDETEVRDVLAGDAYGEDVRGDEEMAARLGISGVPFVVIDRRLGVSGAQAPQVFAQALAQGWTGEIADRPT